jgi:hypothetical protein
MARHGDISRTLPFFFEFEVKLPLRRRKTRNKNAPNAAAEETTRTESGMRVQARSSGTCAETAAAGFGMNNSFFSFSRRLGGFETCPSGDITRKIPFFVRQLGSIRE